MIELGRCFLQVFWLQGRRCFFPFQAAPCRGQNKCTKRQIAQLVANALGCGRAFSSGCRWFVVFRISLTVSLRVHSAQALSCHDESHDCSHQQGSFFMQTCLLPRMSRARHVPMNKIRLNLARFQTPRIDIERPPTHP